MINLKRFTIETPIGELEVLTKQESIILCEFADRPDRITAFLGKYYAGIEIVDIAAPTIIKNIFDDYFSKGTNNFDQLKVQPTGTEHQLKTWKHLQTIPSGTTQSYGELATHLGSAPRAVGNANGKNNIAIIIPCHRVIGADGTLTGYAGGLERKQWLLRHEGAIANSVESYVS